MAIVKDIPRFEADDERRAWTEMSPGRKAYEERMKEWAEEAKNEALRTLNLSKEYNRVPEYIQYLEGDGWVDKRRPQYLSRFYDNRLQHARYNTLAMLTDLRPTIDVRSRVPEFEAQAKIAENVIRYEWYNQGLDLSLVSVVDTAMLYGNAFWKIGAGTPGFMTFSTCAPNMVMPIQPGAGTQDSAAILYRTYKPISYFKERWPERSGHLEEEAVGEMDESEGTTYAKPPRVSEYTWANMASGLKAKIGYKRQGSVPNPSSYPIIELREYWIDDQTINDSTEPVTMRAWNIPLNEQNFAYTVEPGHPLFPRKHLIVFAGNRLMYDGPSPYWHGLYPFAMLRLNPVMWSFWGLSKYRDLIPLNKGINDIGAGTLDMCKRALNPQVVTKEGGVPKAAWDSYFPNMPGGKLRLGPGAQIADVKYLEPPQLPQYTFNAMMFLTQEFERMAGQLDVQKLSGKKQVPGGETIEQMREMQGTGLRLEGRYIEGFLRDAGQIAVPNVFQMYTAARRLKILGASGLSWEDFDYDPTNMVPNGIPPEDHIKNFSLEIAPGSLLGANKERTKIQAMSVFRMGGISRAALLRALEIPDAQIQQIEQELMKEQQAGIAQAGVGGRGSTPRQTRSQRQGAPM